MRYDQAINAAECLHEAGHEHIAISAAWPRLNFQVMSSHVECRRPLRPSEIKPGHYVTRRISHIFVEYEDALAAPISEPTMIGAVLDTTGEVLS